MISLSGHLLPHLPQDIEQRCHHSLHTSSDTGNYSTYLCRVRISRLLALFIEGYPWSLLRRTKQHIIAPLLVPHRASEQLSIYGLESAELRFRRPAGRRPRGPGAWYYQKQGEKLNERRRHGDESITMDTVCRLPCTAITKIHLVF